jgi:Na+-transporting NADH:ubiquinone oxidoreductase subunit NqrF
MRVLEKKRFALISNGNSNATAGIVNNLTNGIIQGDDINQRSGDQIHIMSHTLKVRASAITVNQTFRFIWFRDNMNRGTTPTVTEVLNTANYMSQYAPAALQQKRFTILRDVMLNCNVNGESIKSRSISIPGGVVYYNGATAVAASNGPGALFLLTIGDSLTGLFDFSYEPIYTDA